MQAWCHGTAKIRVLCVDFHSELTRYGQEFPSTFNHGTLDPDLVIRRTRVVALAGSYLECYVRRWAERVIQRVVERWPSTYLFADGVREAATANDR